MSNVKHQPATHKEIPGFLGYTVDELGNVWSSQPWRGSAQRVIAPFVDPDGYKTVRLSINGKRTGHRAHKLVCLAWHGRPKSGQEVRHLDGDHSNNLPSNLCWGTRSENANDRVRHGRDKSAENGRKATAAMLADGRLTRRANGTFQYRGVK